MKKAAGRTQHSACGDPAGCNNLLPDPDYWFVKS
jgi:hypothetical protein